MTEFKFYNQLDPGTRDKKKKALNQAEKVGLKNSSYILEWLKTKL